MQKYMNILTNTPLFQGISESEILPMLKCLSVSIKNYSKGEYLLRSGDKVQTIGMILSGQALIINDDVWGNRNIITELSSGMLYGESYACISSVPAQISVIANENLTVMLFNINHIVTTCSSSCSFHTRLIHNLLEIIAHGEMLPAHAYPELKKYSHLKGNFGTAWQNQQKEFDNIPGAILYTTNCLMPVKPSYADRVFTTEVVSYPEIVHIGEEKDFTPVIEKALALGGYTKDQHMTGINGGIQVTTGFSHGTVLSVADQVIEAVKNGDIKHFFLVGGCDGARVGRNYYTEFVKQSPADSIILTLACGKYRFNDLDLGTIGGLPRIMDMGQCNDAYSAIKVAIALAEAFECDVNELPLSMVLSWYEQKAVCILLTLLYLGIKNIHIGPTLPTFISPNVLNFLVENYGLSPISTPEEDIKKLLNK